MVLSGNILETYPEEMLDLQVDLTMVDVGNLSGIDIEDEVVVMGSQERESITADELALNLNTINYEIVTSITARVPRIYLK